jgi:hypothetical protein
MEMGPATAARRPGGVDLERVFERVVPIALFLTFAMVSAQKLVTWATTGHLWVDLRIYRAAAAEALAGGNPWNVIVDGYYYAAPPTSLLPYVPATFMPVDVATAVYAVVFVVAALAAVRALRLPLWWVLFPPLFEAVIDLNSDVLVLALLLGGPALGGAAVICKVYAAVPLLLQRRWTALAWAAGFALLSLPWWITFFEQRDVVLGRLAYQAGTLSAWGTWLLIPTVIALAYLRGRGASWLAVPALWPSTQLHYSTVGTPAAKRAPLIAFLFCFTIPLLPPLAVILEALRVWFLGWLARRRATRPVVETDAAPAT